MGGLTQRVHDKLNSTHWRSLQELFVQVSEVLLSISPDAQGDLTGTYVKFTSAPSRPAYAAVWPKLTSPKRLVADLALPDDFAVEGLGPAPERMFYPGLTKFLVINEGQSIPEQLSGMGETGV